MLPNIKNLFPESGIKLEQTLRSNFVIRNRQTKVCLLFDLNKNNIIKYKEIKIYINVWLFSLQE